jgi:predicted dehydrogenase
MKNSPASRRQFLKAAALTTLGTAFYGGLITRARADEPQRKLGFALVGLGTLSTQQLAPALQETKYCRLAAIVTGTPAKAERWKAQYNLPDKNIYNYDTMDRMIDNLDIDVVYIVTPNALHAEHTIKAARAGKHVLCEKPMEVSTEKCQSMINECKKAGKQLAIGYRCQFEPYHLECIRLAREKVFGNLHYMEAGFGFAAGNPNQWRLNRALSGGGPMMDVGIYALQAVRLVVGQEPVLVSATASNTDPVKFKDIEESLVWSMKFPNGVLANCNTTYKFSGMNKFSAFADRGSFGLNNAFGYVGQQGFRSDGQEMNFNPVNHFATEMDDFAQCILNNKPTKVPGEEGLRDIRVMMAAYESARTGKAVTLG